MAIVNRTVRGPLFIAGVFVLAAIGSGSSSAQQVTQHAALQTDLQGLQDNAKRSQVRKPRVATAVAATDPATPEASAKPAKKPQSARGPYYVDFRARTAASYGHAFVWYGKTSEKKVDVAGLHPAGDEVPYYFGTFDVGAFGNRSELRGFGPAIPDCELPGLFERGGCTEGLRLYQAPAGDLSAMERPNNQLHGLYRPHRELHGLEGAVPPAEARELHKRA